MTRCSKDDWRNYRGLALPELGIHLCSHGGKDGTKQIGDEGQHLGLGCAAERSRVSVPEEQQSKTRVPPQGIRG